MFKLSVHSPPIHHVSCSPHFTYLQSLLSPHLFILFVTIFPYEPHSPISLSPYIQVHFLCSLVGSFYFSCPFVLGSVWLSCLCSWTCDSFLKVFFCLFSRVLWSGLHLAPIYILFLHWSRHSVLFLCYPELLMLPPHNVKWQYSVYGT